VAHARFGLVHGADVTRSSVRAQARGRPAARCQGPVSLPLDTFDDDAWLGIVAFQMSNVAPRGYAGRCAIRHLRLASRRAAAVPDGCRQYRDRRLQGQPREAAAPAPRGGRPYPSVWRFVPVRVDASKSSGASVVPYHSSITASAAAREYALKSAVPAGLTPPTGPAANSRCSTDTQEGARAMMLSSSAGETAG
jgi:hypothetical protein